MRTLALRLKNKFEFVFTILRLFSPQCLKGSSHQASFFSFWNTCSFHSFFMSCLQTIIILVALGKMCIFLMHISPFPLWHFFREQFLYNYLYFPGICCLSWVKCACSSLVFLKSIEFSDHSFYQLGMYSTFQPMHNSQGQVETKGQELEAALPCGWQKSRTWTITHCLQEARIKLGFKPSNSEMECMHLKRRLKCYAKHPPLKCFT